MYVPDSAFGLMFTITELYEATDDFLYHFVQHHPASTFVATAGFPVPPIDNVIRHTHPRH